MATSLMNDTFITAVDTLTAPHLAMIPVFLLPISRPSPLLPLQQSPQVYLMDAGWVCPEADPEITGQVYWGEPSALTPVGRKQKK